MECTLDGKLSWTGSGFTVSAWVEPDMCAPQDGADS
jgi:hypothetical protein